MQTLDTDSQIRLYDRLPRNKRPAFTLATDRGGKPINWLGWQAVVTLMARDQIAWSTGDTVTTVRGGWDSQGGRSTCEIPAIVACRGRHQHWRNSPALNNPNLFKRDRHTCLYCATPAGPGVRLTRDHVVPRVQGGVDAWENVVTACSRCNAHKGGRTPEQAGMPLLAVPYRPTWAEYLVLANSRILADQMDFLQAFLPSR